MDYMDDDGVDVVDCDENESEGVALERGIVLCRLDHMFLPLFVEFACSVQLFVFGEYIFGNGSRGVVVVVCDCDWYCDTRSSYYWGCCCCC